MFFFLHVIMLIKRPNLWNLSILNINAISYDYKSFVIVLYQNVSLIYIMNCMVTSQGLSYSMIKHLRQIKRLNLYKHPLLHKLHSTSPKNANLPSDKWLLILVSDWLMAIMLICARQLLFVISNFCRFAHLFDFCLFIYLLKVPKLLSC